MDGLPGMKRGLAAAKTYKIEPLKKMVGPLAPTRYHSGLGFGMMQTLLIALLSFLIGLAVAWYGAVVVDSALAVVKGSPLELQAPSWPQASARERFGGLWHTH